jgi:SOS-response transcriptional repressor LexA
MRLYAGSTEGFVQDATRNNIARLLENAFIGHFRYRPPASEVNAWEQSLTRLSLIVSQAQLLDHGIFLEYRLPLTSRRLDAMITGLDSQRHENAVIVELKQWQESEETDAEAMVSTWLGGAARDTLHPSVQAGQYRDYLADMHTAFHQGAAPVALGACAYLHNYWPVDNDPILARKFESILGRVPLFSASDSSGLENYLVSRLKGGSGLPILERIDKGELRPSKKLLDHVAAVIKDSPAFVLLDEQRVVFERALTEAKRGFADGKKRVILVQGGPGTGKSVLAANLIGHLSKLGLHAQYATGSRAFTETLRRIVGSRAAAQFTYFNSYSDAAPNSVDVLICDEAHRIRESSSDRYTPKVKRDTLRPQLDELLGCAKVSVFFIDDRQIVRPGEIGSAQLIRTKAVEHSAELREYRLEAQFRCAGSDGFVNWVDNTLGVQETANQVWSAKSESFEFRMFTSVEGLDAAIRSRINGGATARLVAGFCWPWSKARPDGTLVDDVVVGTYRRPWNAKPDARKLAKGIPKATLWAYLSEGLEQIGCVYTAQGFEFDYVGVIWGRDLRFDPMDQTWIANPQQSCDNIVKRSGSGFSALVKNTYRVLLSRGMKGCYLYCQDQETAKFLLSRTEGLAFSSDQERPYATASQSAKHEEVDVKPQARKVVPLRVVPASERRHFKNCIPVLDLSIAAGQFGEFQTPDPEAIEWVEPPLQLSPSMDLFVARVEGESMNRSIPNGAWCVFRSNPAGTRNGKIVVAQLRNYHDPDSGAAFTIKRYESIKGSTADGQYLENAQVRLKPESKDPAYEPIVVGGDEERIRVIAELVRILE